MHPGCSSEAWVSSASRVSRRAKNVLKMCPSLRRTQEGRPAPAVPNASRQRLPPRSQHSPAALLRRHAHPQRAAYCVRVLVSESSPFAAARIDVNATDGDGRSALHTLAASCGDAIGLTAAPPDFAVVLELLLQSKADVNIQDREGETAIMVACHLSNSAFVDALWNAGVESARNAKGLTALDIATKIDPASKVVRLLQARSKGQAQAS